MKRPMVKILEDRCDGCGACVPSCAEGAIEIVDGKARLIADRLCDGLGACLGECPQDAIVIEEREADAYDHEAVKRHLAARTAPLKQWPIKLQLLHPVNPDLRHAGFVLAADCVGFATTRFHADMLKDRPFAIACPKLDDPQRTIDKLVVLARACEFESITILRMEVPCCGGLEMMTRAALERAGVDIPVESEVVEIGPAFAGRGPVPQGGACPSTMGR
jgi:Pyruvate/2-oxoacid:ferredoxin oxidoreductase delta subunit